MTSQKLEYDSTLGGPVVLASHIPTYRYAAAALKEMNTLMTAVQQPTSTKLVFQTLPKHMRRRAMSHHPKRLPRKYRSMHIAQMSKSGKPKLTKRPSRKFRRRPANLLCDYIRRQRKHVWLETHIWHARRFHMINCWGYRLPYSSCAKNYRACYRASAQHCLLQDKSFYACIQLTGSLQGIGKGFQKISSSKTGLSITAKTYITGKREGHIQLFRNGKYPNGAIASVTFLWQPLQSEEQMSNENIKRRLWIWVHPSAYQTVLMELLELFDMISIRNTTVVIKSEDDKFEEDLIKTESDAKDSTKPKLNVKAERQLQFMTRTNAYERNKCYKNTNGTIELTELKNTMNRFSLTGPLSQSVLSHAFKPKEYNLENEPDNWFRNFLEKNSDFQEFHTFQCKFWQNCEHLNTPATFISNMVIALNIEDPRIHRPQKRTKADNVVSLHHNENKLEIFEAFQKPKSILAQTALWDLDIRNRIGKEMLTTNAYCKLREKHVLVPGASCAFEKELQPIPVLLIQRPGSLNSHYKRQNYGCGWDVIAPAGYGMAIWTALIMWGAKPGGLRETASLNREMGTDEHLPDTIGGFYTAAETYERLRGKYFRLPPNRRCNYTKLAIVSPFRVPYTELVRDWQVTPDIDVKLFHILRDRFQLKELQLSLTNKAIGFPKEINEFSLIQVLLRMKSRGNPGNFALICLPTKTDLWNNLEKIQENDHNPIYTEPLLPDLNEKVRKESRVEHKSWLKRLRARRVRDKRKEQETSNKRVYIRPANTSYIVNEQFKNMCRLWLAENIHSSYSVRRQCTREVFGYITNSSFSYTEATVCAIGYIVPNGLRLLLELCKKNGLKNPMCLVRGTDTRHYRFATMKINTEFR
ncbi:ribonucleases P/MRP protein subunit POP1 [Teleopsis dalmanni]|uniref:ribonucleases P/MRP protein subunit POP1 n=1 Tax=Teleopsis dalmanni TaxID=139649 RepID=UPI0018CF61D3|nr:ribonucleases P/MRP protein subunit POP1 [Teleopsis dalmanni]